MVEVLTHGAMVVEHQVSHEQDPGYNLTN